MTDEEANRLIENWEIEKELDNKINEFLNNDIGDLDQITDILQTMSNRYLAELIKKLDTLIEK